jgi:hypothetical protein
MAAFAVSINGRFSDVHRGTSRHVVGANSGIPLSYYMWRHSGFGGGAHFNFGHIMFAEEPLTTIAPQCALKGGFAFAG